MNALRVLANGGTARRALQTRSFATSLREGSSSSSSSSSSSGSRRGLWYFSASLASALLGGTVVAHCSSEYDLAKAEQIINDPSKEMRDRMEAFVRKLQREIVTALSEVENSSGGERPPKDFVFDEWKREEGGGGISCVLQDGAVFEKAGVNISIIHGHLGPAAVKQMNTRGKGLEEGKTLPFFAAGISLVVHPVNPMAPTVHMNYRYFEVDDGKGGKSAWFGGGADLTPSFIFEEDCVHFHKTLEGACSSHDPKLYPELKKACDEYFFLSHRQEGRGIGGIFFDDFDTPDLERAFRFIRKCGEAFVPAYLPIINRRKGLSYSEDDKKWQQLRRGRYVEFNLIHDRGTKFGLFTPGARIESILMSLPLTARWEYMAHPMTPKQEELVQVLRNPRDWLKEAKN